MSMKVGRGKPEAWKVLASLANILALVSMHEHISHGSFIRVMCRSLDASMQKSFIARSMIAKNGSVFANTYSIAFGEQKIGVTKHLVQCMPVST